MPRADFYQITRPRFREQPLLLVCELARKAFESDQPLLILARDMAQAEALDDLLWSFSDEAYLPHQIVGSDEDDEITPILIATPGMSTPPRKLLLNLRDEVPELAFERVLEVVPADESALEPLRERWRAYRARGMAVQKFDM